jgi:hypothetical protein
MGGEYSVLLRSVNRCRRAAAGLPVPFAETEPSQLPKPAALLAIWRRNKP